MIAVIFEVEPLENEYNRYLDISAELHPLLMENDGFISVERFQSLSNPSKLLSLSFWRDEAAIEDWRRLNGHRQAQSEGRNTIFRDYRLRAAKVYRDYGKTQRDQAPSDSDIHHRHTKL